MYQSSEDNSQGATTIPRFWEAPATQVEGGKGGFALQISFCLHYYLLNILSLASGMELCQTKPINHKAGSDL